jgi:pimeloyl-ACP methyl ester carboxylesterase
MIKVLSYLCDCPKGALRIVLVLALTVTAFGQHTLATREFFYAGGNYSGPPLKEVMAGQMYVEVLRPQRVTQKYPIVFFHGGGQTATNWMGTPDGRAGWADYFLAQGYTVYLTDQPARGRSPWNDSRNGPLTMPASGQVERQFTAPEILGAWPQAKKHTQWPGQGEKKGRRGDPIFDAFYSTQVQGLRSGGVETQTLVRSAGTALLDKIGPAILVTHSQAGPFGWLLADSRPKAVKAIIAVEPSGPPFRNTVANVGNEDKARSWGIADIPLTYSPPAATASDLAPVREQVADGPNLTICWKQPDPPRQLPNLKGIPILIITTEASYHALYDQCTSKYLTQAGVQNTHMRLEELGIHGNGHMVMLEKNNIEVAAVLQKWISAHVK